MRQSSSTSAHSSDSVTRWYWVGDELAQSQFRFPQLPRAAAFFDESVCAHGCVVVLSVRLRVMQRGEEST